jgi:hypothetical protein
MAKNSKKFIISINHHTCPIFHAENNLSKLQFNFAHFIGLILTLRGPASLPNCRNFETSKFTGLFRLNIQVCNKICLQLENKIDLIENGLKVEKSSSKYAEKSAP